MSLVSYMVIERKVLLSIPNLNLNLYSCLVEIKIKNMIKSKRGHSEDAALRSRGDNIFVNKKLIVIDYLGITHKQAKRIKCIKAFGKGLENSFSEKKVVQQALAILFVL